VFKKSTTINKVYKGTVYDNGRYVWGFNHEKVSFPKLFQKEELLLSVANKEGVMVNLAVSFWWRLREADLDDVYKTFGTSYRSLLLSQAKSVIRNTAVDFSVNEFLGNRSLVRDQLATNVESVLDEMHISAPNNMLHLHDEVGFTDLILSTHLEAAIVLEDNLLREYSQDSTLIRTETAKRVAEYTKNITVITRGAEANKTASIATAQAQYDRIIADARGSGQAMTMDALGIESGEQKKKFLKYMAILDNAGAMVVSLEAGVIVNLG